MASPHNRHQVRSEADRRFRRASYCPDLPQLRIADPWMLAVIEPGELSVFANDFEDRSRGDMRQIRLLRKDIPHDLRIEPDHFGPFTLHAGYELADRHFDAQRKSSEAAILGARAGKWSIRQLGRSLLAVTQAPEAYAGYDDPSCATVTVPGHTLSPDREINLTLTALSRLAKIPRKAIPNSAAPITAGRLTGRDLEHHEHLLALIDRALRGDSGQRRSLEDYEPLARAIIDDIARI